MKEALERQKELDPTITDETISTTTEDNPSGRNGEQESSQNDISPTETSSWKEREEKKEEEKTEECSVEVEEAITKKEDPVPVTAAEEPKESPEKTDEPEEEDRPQTSLLGEQVISSTFFCCHSIILWQFSMLATHFMWFLQY